MSKRYHTIGDDVPSKKVGAKISSVDGLFEDVSSDEYESEEEEIFQQSEDSEDDDVLHNGSTDRYSMAWLPGSQLAEDETLEADQSAYELLHCINVKWPCLSCDFLWDQMGEERRVYPASCYLVTGTQADLAKHNEIQVIKCSNLVRTQMSDNSSVSSQESTEDEPVLVYRSIPVSSGINRIRCTQQKGQAHLVATMTECSLVNIYDVDPHLNSIDCEPGHGTIARDPKQNLPIYTITCHKSEGFALDWSSLIYGSLVTGDNSGYIYITSRDDQGSFFTDSKPFTGHRGSVEDLQWSPSEKTVFASCSSDGTIKIWDTRSKNRTAAISVLAHDTDINVLSWNSQVSYLLATGSDDGIISIWDLRTFSQQSPSSSIIPVASFTWHKQAITSVHWHPTDESVLVAAGADDQITIWDLSVELDAEERASKDAEGLAAVPPQLMFVHLNQTHIKEVRWARQLPGVLLSTAQSGFNLFKSAHQS